MKIVAFLQNMWVRSPRTATVVAQHDATSPMRERMIAYALFAGCLTGRRLRSALGDWCEKIIWQEANPTVSTNPREYLPPDIPHIGRVLGKHAPDVVVCFTKSGERAIIAACRDRSIRFIPCVHPACRAIDTVEKLRGVRALLDGKESA